MITTPVINSQLFVVSNQKASSMISSAPYQSSAHNIKIVVPEHDEISVHGQTFFAPKFTPSQQKRSTADHGIDQPSRHSKRTYVTSQTTQHLPHFRLDLPLSPPLQSNAPMRNSTLGCSVGGVALRKPSEGVTSETSPGFKVVMDLVSPRTQESLTKKASNGQHADIIDTIISNDGAVNSAEEQVDSEGADHALHTFALQNGSKHGSKNGRRSSSPSAMTAHLNALKRDSSPVDGSNDVLDLIGQPGQALVSREAVKDRHKSSTDGSPEAL